jgi:hypothetical protein
MLPAAGWQLCSKRRWLCERKAALCERKGAAMREICRKQRRAWSERLRSESAVPEVEAEVLACGARALAARKGVWGDGKSVCRTQGQRRELGPITCWMEAVTKCARVWKRAQNGAKYAGAEQCCFWHYSGICGVVSEVVVSRVARGITAGLRCTEMHGVCVDQLRIKWGSIIEGCLGVLAKLGSCMTKMCPRQQRLPRGSWGDVLRVCRLDKWLSHILTGWDGIRPVPPQAHITRPTTRSSTAMALAQRRDAPLRWFMRGFAPTAMGRLVGMASDRLLPWHTSLGQPLAAAQPWLSRNAAMLP